MSTKRVSCICLFTFSLLSLHAYSHGAPVSCQAAEPPEHSEQSHHGMEMNTLSGATDRCEPKFTYEAGLLGPSHWEGLCITGQMQTPIDITKTEKVAIPPLPPLQFSYQPAPLDVVNDCNKYQLKIRFPDNLWLKVARKPYRLSEIDFHEPSENAVEGKRAPMSIQLVHLSPEATFLIIEVPVVVGKENPVIKTLWQHIPAAGKEKLTSGVKINAMDLLPTDHSFYRFPGSLTTPICNQGVTWFLMKHPIEMSKAQIAKYREYYHDTARPLQPVNNRPVIESN